ncbi:MAG: hypothetical protein EA401_00725, partial [Planctomycetota bacterium]
MNEAQNRIPIPELASYWEEVSQGGKLGPYGLSHWYALGRFGHVLAFKITKNLLASKPDVRNALLEQVGLELEEAEKLVKSEEGDLGQGFRASLVKYTRKIAETEKLQGNVEQLVDRRIEQITDYFRDLSQRLVSWPKNCAFSLDCKKRT